MRKNLILAGVLAAGLFVMPTFGWSGEVRKLNFKSGKDGSAVFTVFFSGKGKFRVMESDARGSLVLEADGIELSPRFTKLIDASTMGGPVMQITPYKAGNGKKPMSKFVLQLKDQVKFVASEVPGKFTLELKAKKEASGGVAVGNKAHSSLARPVWSETDTLKNVKSAMDKSEEIAKRLLEVLNAPPEDKAYFGSRVTFEGSEVDVHDIFRLVGAASDLNIMTDKDVDYKTDISVSDIPWDQLLDIVLQQGGLKATVTGNVVRIISGETYAKQQEAKLREIDLADKNAPVVMAVIPLSFATAEDMKTMIEALLVKRESAVDPNRNSRAQDQTIVLNGAGGENGQQGNQTVKTIAGKAVDIKLAQDFVRGQIQVDSRSNSLVVTNTKEAIERIRKLITELDVPLPQVLIDAKIIIAQDDFSRTLGILWGGRGVSSSGRAGVGGAFNGQSVNLGAGSDDSAAFTISSGGGDNPVTGALGFQIGAGRHGNLNAQLRMGETTGLSKTVASPRVIVNNKKQAKILDGQTIFISSDAGANASGTLTQVDAALTLTVTPQVTSVGSVLMDVDFQKGQPTIPVNGQTALQNKQITTQVLVNSGNTLVLGGVYQDTKETSEAGIPWLKDLPFIGQLFRTNTDSDKRSEMMAFITPEIMDIKVPEAQ